MARLIDSSILKFLLVGVGNTLLSMALMFLLRIWATGPPPPSPMWLGR